MKTFLTKDGISFPIVHVVGSTIIWRPVEVDDSVHPRMNAGFITYKPGPMEATVRLINGSVIVLEGRDAVEFCKIKGWL